jgi:acetyl esterase/lipase
MVTETLMAQQKVINLYNGRPAGSEEWTWEEKIDNSKFTVAYNVVQPSMSVFSPEPVIANGTAVIVCPGGGFHFLAINWEGNDVAKLLVKKGITVFVLKYRLVHVLNDDPFKGDSPENQKAWDDESLPVIPLAVEDGRAAIAYVRAHAKEYNIVTDRIGIMGFSAGGRVAASTAFNYTKENRPDFVAPIYGDMPESLQTQVIPLDAPPLFLACAQDDEFGFASHAIGMYNKWYDAKRPVEMHLFAKGGHGFGVGSAKNTTYQWIDRLGEWLEVEGLIKINR